MIRYIILSTLVLTGCSKTFTHKIDGVILENTRDDLLQYDGSKITLHISSQGGKVGPSFEIAEFLMDKDVTVIVDNVCNSACSQLLLPIADEINFEKDPLVGFHFGAILDFEYLEQHTGGAKECSDLYDFYKREKVIMNHSKLNSEFWKEIDKRLVPQNYKTTKYPNDDCKEYEYKFQHMMWYPTSLQMRELLGLEFTGTVCADKFDLCSKRLTDIAINLGAKEPFTSVMGDEIYSFSPN